VVTNYKLVVFVILIFTIFFIVPIFQDYNSKSLKNYEVVNCKTYEVKLGDTLSEIAERFKPENMKLSNYIVEIQYANSIGYDIMPGEKILIPMVRR